MNRRASALLWVGVLLYVTLSACSGGTTSSGPTSLAGRYVGSVTVGGVTKAAVFTVTPDGFVEPEFAGGGVVCAGDVPQRIGLDNNRFDLTTSGQCIVGGRICPLNIIITGAIADKTITGSGSVLLACGGGPVRYIFKARIQ